MDKYNNKMCKILLDSSEMETHATFNFFVEHNENASWRIVYRLGGEEFQWIKSTIKVAKIY